MAERTVVVTNETGLHARPAASLVQFVKKLSRWSNNHKRRQRSKCKEHLQRYEPWHC